MEEIQAAAFFVIIQKVVFREALFVNVVHSHLFSNCNKAFYVGNRNDCMKKDLFPDKKEA